MNRTLVVLFLLLAIPASTLAQTGRLPSPVEAALSALGLATLITVIRLLNSVPAVRRALLRQDDGPLRSWSSPLLRSLPPDAEGRRAATVRYRERLEHLRRWRFAPSWLWPLLAAGQLPHVVSNPWRSIVLAWLLVLATLAVAEPFRLRRGLERLRTPPQRWVSASAGRSRTGTAAGSPGPRR